MSTVISLVVMAALLAVPAVVVHRMYRDEIRDRLHQLGALLAFDPRHPALTYRSDAERR